MGNDPSVDLAGNRVNRSDSGAPGGQVTLHYEYDDNDRLTSVSGFSSPFYNANYTYDANGNTLTVSGTNVDPVTYTWDIENRLVHADVTDHTTGTTRHVDYQYNDSGNRISQTVDGQKTTYLNDANQAFDQVLEEYAPGRALAATYVRGLDLLFQDRTGTRSYYAKDGLGSTRALTNVSGAVTDTYIYDAFGNTIAQTGTTPSEFLFAGQQFDGSIQQYYARARYYNQATGEFDSRDSSNGLTADPITLNHYIYGGADPVDHIDPSGHDFTVIGTLGLASIQVELNALRLDAVAPLINTAVNAVASLSSWAEVTISNALGTGVPLAVLVWSGIVPGGGDMRGLLPGD